MYDKKAEILKAKLLAERGKYKNDTEFAAKLRVQKGTLSKWLNTSPAVWPRQHLEEIAEYFGSDIDSLTQDPKKTPRGKERVGTYNSKEIRDYLESLPLSEQVGYAMEVLSRTRELVT